jgi:hypothetical protein
MPKSTAAALSFVKFRNTLEFGLHDWDKNHLRNTLTNFNGKSAVAAIPAGNHDLPLIIRIDQAYQVTQHNPVFMP